MQMDREALEGIENLRVAYYSWPSKSISVGALFDPSMLLDLEALAHGGWTLYSRTGGGGVMFHGGDICFSLAAPASHPLFSMTVLESYRAIHQALAKALCDINPELKNRLSFASDNQQATGVKNYLQSCCLAQSTIYDLLLDGKKVAGCSQRRRKALIHQISLSLELPNWDELKKLFREQGDIDTIMRRNYCALGSFLSKERAEIAKEIASSLAKALKSSF